MTTTLDRMKEKWKHDRAPQKACVSSREKKGGHNRVCNRNHGRGQELAASPLKGKGG